MYNNNFIQKDGTCFSLSPLCSFFIPLLPLPTMLLYLPILSILCALGLSAIILSRRATIPWSALICSLLICNIIQAVGALLPSTPIRCDIGQSYHIRDLPLVLNPILSHSHETPRCQQISCTGGMLMHIPSAIPRSFSSIVTHT